MDYNNLERREMISESVMAVYEGKGVIRLREQPVQLQEDQELLITIVPLPKRCEGTDETRPSPEEYFYRIVKGLHRYERKYRMTSEEFYRRFQSGDIQEGPFDYFDWRVLYDGYRYMQDHFGFSRESLADA